MRGVRTSWLLLLLSAALLAAAPGEPTAGVGDTPDVLDVEGATPGSSGGSGGSGASGGSATDGGQHGGSGTGPSGPGSGSGGAGGTPGDGSSAGGSSGTDPSGATGGVDAFEPSWSVQAATGQPCILLSRRPGVAPDSELGLQWDLRTLHMMVDPRLLGRSDRFCAAVAGTGAVASPHAEATAFVRSITLPAPELSIPPGIALTGLTTYLVIDGQEGFTVRDDLPGWGPLAVRFAPVATVVDWGDGTRMVIEDGRRGAPYGGDPEQQITHVYDHRNPDIEVVVTTLWRASWSVGTHGGAVHGLRTGGVLPLPVRSFEAVRLAPDA